MKKIEKLTPEQEAELPAFRQRYLHIACGGGRIDRDTLQGHLTAAYAMIGKPAPALFIFDSPAACMLALKIFKMPKESQLRSQLRSQLESQLWSQLGSQLESQLGSQLRSQLESQLWSQLRSQLWSQLGSQLRSQLWSQLWNQLWSQLGSQLESQLGSQLWSQLRSQLGSQLWSQLWSQLGSQLGSQLRSQLRSQNIYDSNYLWGSQDLYWLAFYRFAQSIGVKYSKKDAKALDIMEGISTQCEWWFPYDGIVIASERPTSVRWDGERRLHCETGPAVEYADGYELYSWRGISIPAEWVKHGPPASKDIMRIENTEQRRIAAEMRGWHNILPEIGAILIDAHANPQVGELWQADLPDNGPERFLKVQCGTGRTFAIPVGMEFATAREANAATYGIAPQILDQLEIRT